MRDETMPQGADEVPLTTHEYDGIQEFDNPMPAWWRWMFIATIVWSPLYILGIELRIVPNYEDNLTAELAVQRGLQEAGAVELPGTDEGALLAAAADPSATQQGGELYMKNCAACHGPQGQGLIGPNLTDDAWLHGGSLGDIHRVVTEGVPAKGMPPWGPVLSATDVVAVVAFLETLRGTNPPNPKAPEGAPHKPSGDSASLGDTANDG